MAQGTGAGPEPDLKGFADLADEFTEYVDALNLEKEVKLSISRFLRDAQAALAGPVKVDPRRLSKWFPGAKEAVLEDGVRLTVKKKKNETTTYPVLQLEHDAYCAVMEEVGAVVARLMEEAEAKRAAEARPVLQAFARLRGRKVAMFDWRNCELMLANTGGSAKKVVLALPGNESGSYGPLDIGALETTTVPLRGVSVGEAALKVRVSCEDEDGRGYSGEVELEPNSKGVRIVGLSPAE
ncbi:MAG: hypothetical protein JRN56_07075 [Nitrososphaerota archaeon]|nr:hypothetical protein [Nitrososphaerota archaeon]MDG6909671.1 hypothetical protein [Nitrososphaerota archaeon]MDG6937525.1 hypothetical protein [Nitrososphaerota archaeon]MDG6961667.1 hypothetical protein [Nitrososphaerota archaeon]MDG6980506.1 hypothetical protein [Nitrososphaerota archaeon]